MEKTVELTIEKLAVGGDGLAFLDGKAVFVPFTLPGERVRALLGEEGARRDWASAEVLEVLEPSADRVLPECPLFGVCGGCSLQHMDYARQTREKAAIVRDCFSRTGGLAVPRCEVTPSAPYGYRNRMQFHLTAQGRLALMRRSSDELVETPTCPVAAKPIRDWMESRSGRSRDDLRSYIVDKDRFLVFAAVQPGEADGKLYVEGRDGEARALVAGREIEFHVKGFFQSNLQTLDALVPSVVSGLEGRRAADLYCGVGLFGSFLKESFEKVVCVEHNPFALEYARRNVGARGEYHDLAVEEWVKSPSARARFDAVVIDPPRSGLAPAVREWLAARKIPLVSYVSCDPATLARDLKALASAGYAVEDARVYDFFPQTGHVETHVRLRSS